MGFCCRRLPRRKQRYESELVVMSIDEEDSSEFVIEEPDIVID